MLREAVNYFLNGEQGSKAGEPLKTGQKSNSSIHIFKNVVTSAHVRQAYISGVDLRVSHSAVVTPLARDLANQYGVTLKREDVI